MNARPALLLRGFAPLVLLVALLIVVAILVPSVAPEQYAPETTTTTESLR